ncbi:MAG: tRNA (adenosine(37)-N6)-dimethylallyltransferase MiaA [Candidatus Omnitrophota bacterium]
MAERLIFLVGPTAIGKTEVSVELAKLLNCEIISCDSMQVYKGMDIATSKPAKVLLDAVLHHMINIIEPSEEFSAALFRELAVKAMKEILAKSKSPLFVGGSGLYVKVLIDGIFEGPSSDRELRARLKAEADEFGAEVLYKRLKDVDSETALKVHPNDLRRILRALEVYEKAKAPISMLKNRTHGLSENYKIKMFGLDMDRQALYKKIDERVDAMFETGLVDEARRLMGRNLSLTASQALGYKEVFGFLKGEYGFDEAKRLVKRNTRRYAKRQLTWFRKDKKIDWIIVEEDSKPEEIAKGIWKRLS